MFTVGAFAVIMAYYLYVTLTEAADNNTMYVFLIGALNGGLNFTISVIYEALVEYLVSWENHM